jgi:predicted dehydrogenase
VADPDVDIVYVSTPHPMHHDAARLALENGKHVLVEKPFTVNRDEADDLRRVAAERGLLAMEAMWTRYLPHMIRIREIIEAGQLGEIRAVAADHTQKITDDPGHRLNDLDLGGGALLDLGIYPISFIWDILGSPETIAATARLGETGADTEVATIMTHAGGAVSTSLTSSRAAGPNTASIIGTEARIEIDGTVRETYESRIDGRGMQYQALAAERLVRDGILDGDILPIAETVAIMGTLDEIRAQIGVRYPSEERADG